MIWFPYVYRTIPVSIDDSMSYYAQLIAIASVIEKIQNEITTIEETLNKIILRRECLNLIYEVKSINNLIAYPEQWKRLSELYNTPFCKEIITDRFNEFKPIETM